MKKIPMTLTALLTAVICLCGCQQKQGKELVSDWTQTMQKAVEQEALVQTICETLEKEAESTEPVNVSVDENILIFSVKTTRTDEEAYNDIFDVCGKEIQTLLSNIRQKGVDYPCAQIQCTDKNGSATKSFALES